MATDENKAPAFDPSEFVRNLTHRPGVYCMLGAKSKVIYVGKARDLRRRVASYFSGRAQDAKTLALVNNVQSVEVTVTRTEAEALMLEYNLIKRHKPRYNVVLRDDKSYPYIHISTNQKFPRLSFYRGSRKKSGRLFGPFPSAGSVRETLRQLQKLFQVRQCEDSYFSNRSRPCLQYQIQRCTAPCVGLVSTEEYANDVANAMLFLQGDSDAVTESLADRMEQSASEQRYERAAQYRDQLAKLKSIQSSQLVSQSKGNFDVVAMVAERNTYCVTIMFFRSGRSLGSRNFFPRHVDGASAEEIIRAFLLQHYGGREAPREILVSREVPDATTLAEMLTDQTGHRVEIKWQLRGDRARLVDLAMTNARHGAEVRNRSQASVALQLDSLTDVLELEERPRRLECFDVSHTAGESTVASCVVFTAEGPLKSAYRRFNIRGLEPGDDYGAMKDVLTRRYRRLSENEGSLPDVVLVDGGRGQLEKAVGVFAELALSGVCLVGVAKGEGRKAGRESLYLPGRSLPIKLGAGSPALHLVQQLRDEAHRFALAGHRGQRQKRVQRSTLEAIGGLGPKRRQAILRQFGGLQAVARAGVDDLARIKGISRRLAEAIYERFHAE